MSFISPSDLVPRLLKDTAVEVYSSNVEFCCY